MIKKPILLILALLLPVSIFLFLHFFGKNEFEIPVYYQSDVEGIPRDCQINYSFPYKIENDQIGLGDENTLVFFASGLSLNELKEAKFQLDRIHDEFGSNTPKLVYVISSSDTLTIPQLPDATVLSLENYDLTRHCIFLAMENRIVLVDSQKQIRGLYADARLKQVDRIILELKILFKEY